MRLERSVRRVPKSSLRMNGAYSTTPDTMAINSKKPIAPRNSMPGRPRNMSVCSCRMKSITPPSWWPGTSSPLVRSKEAKCISPSEASGVGPLVTFTTGRSVSKLMNSGT